MIIVYTGNGKGKTSACIGQAIRALGQNMAVGFGQFIKRDNVAGEQAILRALLGSNFRAGGIGFYKKEQQEAHCAKAQELLKWAAALSVQMLILDEALYALNHNLITKTDIERFTDKFCDLNCHLILSGRNAPDWLINIAQIVTVMEERKHICHEGIWQVRGIEY